ncbi:MAG: hypothetical protein IJ393_00105 [Clostridia bacterium]|nr:hypothetical protein [Clostridia bacterium]
MRSFKNYTKEAKGVESQKDDTVGAEELTRRIANAYNGRSNSDMLKSILLEAEKSKRAGTLSNEEIEAFYQSFAPMLDSSQRKRLRQIVERLKQI